MRKKHIIILVSVISGIILLGAIIGIVVAVMVKKTKPVIEVYADKITKNNEFINISKPSQKFKIHGHYDIIKNKSFMSIRGKPDTKISFPHKFKKNNWSIVYVTRYIGHKNHRILTGLKNNWVLGHWNNKAGVFYQNNWIGSEKQSRISKNDYLLCIERPGKIIFRSNNPNSKWIHLENKNTKINENEIGIGINNGLYANENSDFEFAYLAIYDKNLSRHINNIKLTLEKKYIIKKQNTSTPLPIPSVVRPTPPPKPPVVTSAPSLVPVVSKPSPVPVVSKPSPVPVVSKPSPVPVVSTPRPVPVVSTPAPSPSDFVQDGTYSFHVSSNDKLILSSPAEAGKDSHLKNVSEGWVYWKIKKLPDGYYTITMDGTNYPLTAYGGAKQAGMVRVYHAKNPVPLNYKWKFVKHSDGTFNIVSVHNLQNNLQVSVWGGVAAGLAIRLNGGNSNSANHKWRFKTKPPPVPVPRPVVEVFGSKKTANNELVNEINPSQKYKIQGSSAIRNNGKFSSIVGNTSTIIEFPHTFKNNSWTVVYVTRFTGNTKGRILSGKGQNWVLGHWNTKAGVFHQNGWIGDTNSKIPINSYILSIETPGKVHYRSSDSNSSWKSLSAPNLNIVNETGICINSCAYGGEKSDFDFGYLSIHDRVLNDNEINSIKNNLINRFAFTGQTPTPQPLPEEGYTYRGLNAIHEGSSDGLFAGKAIPFEEAILNCNADSNCGGIMKNTGNNTFWSKKQDVVNRYVTGKKAWDTPNSNWQFWSKNIKDKIKFVGTPSNSVMSGIEVCKSQGMNLATREELKNAYDVGYRKFAWGRDKAGIVLPHTTFNTNTGGNQGNFCIVKTNIPETPSGVKKCRNYGLYYDSNKNETLSSYRVPQYDPAQPNRHGKYYFRNGSVGNGCENKSSNYEYMGNVAIHEGGSDGSFAGLQTNFETAKSRCDNDADCGGIMKSANGKFWAKKKSFVDKYVNGNSKWYDIGSKGWEFWAKYMPSDGVYSFHVSNNDKLILSSPAEPGKDSHLKNISEGYVYWKVKRLPDGYYTITMDGTNYPLTAYGGAKQANMVRVYHAKNPVPLNYKWKFVKHSDGTFNIVSVHNLQNNLQVSVWGGVAAGLAIRLNGGNSNSPNHKWRLKTKPNHRSMVVTEHHTPFNSEGGGNTVYLDKHSVVCPVNSSLNKFHLNREVVNNKLTGNFRYSFKCNSSPDTPGISQMVKKHTPYNDEGGGNFAYLDRHPVQCPTGSIKYFHLNRDGRGKYRYSYECNNAPMYDKSVHHTRIGDLCNGNSVCLDKHNVECPKGKVLIDFKLRPLVGNKVMYQYGCARYANTKDEIEKGRKEENGYRQQHEQINNKIKHYNHIALEREKREKARHHASMKAKRAFR